MGNFKADKDKAFTLHEAGSTHLFASEVFSRPQKPKSAQSAFLCPYTKHIRPKNGRTEGDPAKSGPEPERPAAARKLGNRTLKPP